MITSLIFFCFAAVFSACMDTIKDHFEVSIFKRLNPDFWKANQSWDKSFNLFGSFDSFRWVTLDAWHVFKFNMIACIACFGIFWENEYGLSWIVLIPSLFILWGLVFELFYSVILKRK